MANANILKLKVDSNEYEGKIKRAQQGILHLSDSLHKAGKSFADADKEQLAFIQELGKMETVSKSAKGKVNELSAAFVEMKMMYKQMTDEEKASTPGKALTESLDQLKTRLKDTKEQLADVKREMEGTFDNVKIPDAGGLGDFKDMMSVFGGNMMTKAAELGTQALSALGQEIVETTKRSMQLSAESEGIRLAFDRLNRPGLLDNLREATHGTVNDIELMKAAVRFDDFNLPLDQLGTMLAFAQQKAKDTGQSIDYMVDSIVMGLGRQSVKILDNLGLSATDIKERMKETGDMTVAVGDIIREQMANAGDYVETASDRAAKATAEYENQLVELGDQIRETFGVGSMEEFNMYLKTELAKTIKFTIDWFNDAKIAINNVWNAYTELTAPIDAVYNKVEEIANSNAITRWMLKIESLINPLLHVYTLVKSIGNELGLGGGGGGLGNAFQRVSQLNGNRPHEGTFTVVRDGSGKVLSATSNGKDVTAQYIKNNQPAAAMDDKKKKGGGGRGGGSKGETDQEKAAKMVANAERTYAETMQKEALRLESGIDDELAAKKKELSAQERLFDAYNDAYATYKDPKYKDEISKTADKIKELGTEIKGMEDAVKQAKVKVEMAEGLSGFNAQTMNAWMQGRQSDLSKAEYGSQDYSTIMGNIADMNAIKTIIEQAMQAGINVADLNLDTLWEKVFDGENIPDEVWQNLVDQINEKLKELDIKPIEIDFKTGKVKKQAKEMKTDWQAAASAIQSVGTAMSQIEDPAAKVIGTIAQAIATIAQGFAIATSKEANKGVWNWIAAIAAGTATMLSTIATIKSVTKGGFAEGGIVPGNSMSGDNLPLSDYGINSGELILSRAQQSNLASQLTGGGVQNLRLSATITGEQIRLALNNNGKRTGRGEYITSNFMR